MPFTRFPIRKARPIVLTMHVKEIVTYPKVQPPPGSNPCAEGQNSCVHILACGHSVVTSEPDQVCGSNCWGAVHSRARSMGNQNFGTPLWCDACVEEKIEARIVGQNISAQVAENRRDELRAAFQREDREAQLQSRKTYINEKRVTLPIDEKGQALPGYQAPKAKHPFEVGTLHAGRSFFEDIDPTLISVQGKQPTEPTLVVRQKALPRIGFRANPGKTPFRTNPLNLGLDADKKGPDDSKKNQPTIDAATDPQAHAMALIPNAYPSRESVPPRARHIMNAAASPSDESSPTGPAPAIRRPLGQ